MRWNTLSETLIELADAVAPQDAGLVVTEAELSIPLEVRVDPTPHGIVVHAQPGHSRWQSGFLPPVHMARISLVLESGDAR